MSTWEWINVRPGVLSLRGTPIQIRRENMRIQVGEFEQPYAFCIYEGDRFVKPAKSLAFAKQDAINIAIELIEMGLCEEPSA